MVVTLKGFAVDLLVTLQSWFRHKVRFPLNRRSASAAANRAQVSFGRRVVVHKSEEEEYSCCYSYCRYRHSLGAGIFKLTDYALLVCGTHAFIIHEEH
jgi:hypothetical protein